MNHDFERLKIDLMNGLNALREMVQNPDTVAKIHAIQRAIQALEQF